MAVAKNKDGNSQLIPDRYPQGDLFICDVADAVLKDIMPQMEHPFYSLSKKPDTAIRRYEHNGNWLEVIPSVKGMATIYDKDILIYGISQIMAKINRGEQVSQSVRISARDVLMFTNRGTSGKDYNALCEAFDRLTGTRIKTNIAVNSDEEQTDWFNLIDSASVKRKNGLDGRLEWVQLKLSDWVFDAIEKKQVLTLNRDYFRLRKPIERRIYELARKHCGRKESQTIDLDILYKKSGSQGNIRLFRQAIKHLAAHNHLPDYTIKYDSETNKVTFYNREQWWSDHSDGDSLPPLPTTAYEEAKKVAPNHDVYHLEVKFREWWAKTKKPLPGNIEAAFIGFCKKFNKNR